VDAGVHHLQGKAEGVTATELQQLLRAFYLERLALLMRHEAVARLIGDYDINNAYQYAINREETHISWLQHALLAVGAEIPPDPAAPSVSTSRKGDEAVRELCGEDARGVRQYVDKWRDRIEQVSNARHKGMLLVILGEMLEQQRMFEQAAEGRRDVIGKAMDIHQRRGSVLATRWVGQ
jgi:hypothetical protein